MGGDPPDPAKGYVAGIQADLETLPQRRLVEAAAKLGKKITIDIPGVGPQTFDFSGLGDSDYQSQFGDQMASKLLQLQRDMGPAYVEQRLQELEAADPEGAQMRRRLWSEIQSGVQGGPTARPDLQAIQDRVMADLNRGTELDPETSERVSQSVVGGQVARGNYLGNAAATEEASALTSAGEAEQNMRRKQAMEFLTGGLSPDDAAMRESQQNMANLGAFMSGETPVAQFGQLSGAQVGAAPFNGGGALPGVNPNAGAEGVAFSGQKWNIDQQARQGQVNPWVAGLSGAFQGANAWAAMSG